MLEVIIQGEQVTYVLKKGDNLTIYHAEEEINLTEDQPSKVMDLVDKVPG